MTKGVDFLAKVDKGEQLKRIDEKLSKLKAQRQAIVAREKQKERKERTRLLIQIGALSEKYFRSPDISPTDFELLAQKIVALPGFGDLFLNSDD